MDFFREATSKVGCWRLEVAVAVANFYVFPLKRLTLTTASPASSRKVHFQEFVFERSTLEPHILIAAPGSTAISRAFGEVSSQM